MKMLGLMLAVLFSSLAVASADDWPTYLHDSDRSGATAETLLFPLTQDWKYQSPGVLRGAWSAAVDQSVEGRDFFDLIRFDNAIQVAVVDDRVYFGSPIDHQLHCFDASSGIEHWSFFTGAPIHLAPTVADGRLYVGSDDGFGYCLDARNGKLIWKYRPGPQDERFIGRGEMISRWPVRTGILVDKGVAYFGAGIFPHENVYVCAVDAKDGTVLWRNDHISHAKAGREDLSPQGYLLASPYHIYVPSGRTRPKSFDRKTGRLFSSDFTQVGITSADAASTNIGKTSGVDAGTNAIMRNGKLKLFSLGAHIAGTGVESYVTTGSYVARLDDKSFSTNSKTSSLAPDEQRQSFRKLYGNEIDDAQYDEFVEQLRQRIRSLNDQTTLWRTPATANSSLIVAGDHVIVGGENEVLAYDGESGQQVWRAEVDGEAKGLAVANGRLIVSTTNGQLYSFSNATLDHASNSRNAAGVSDPFPEDEWTAVYRDAAEQILKRSGVTRGFCLVLDSDDGRLAFELARHSDLRVYAVEADEQKVAASRRAIASTGLYGSRVIIHNANAASTPYSSYFANMIVSDRQVRTGAWPSSPETIARHLKPAGGVICLRGSDTATATGWIKHAGLINQCTVEAEEGWVTLRRGTLPGAGNWSHQYADPGNTASSGDKLVQGGLGVLWYGDPGPELMVERHQGAVGPLVVNGRMFVQGEESLMAYDVYNGLFLWEVKNPEALRTGVFNNVAPGNLAASDDRLFHLVRDRVIAHDAATGEVRAVYELPSAIDSDTHEWGYLAVRDGRLIGTATTREIIERQRRRRGNPGAAATDAIFAVDIESGKHLWLYQGKSINFQTIALGPNRVFFIDSSVTSEQREEILRQDKRELKLLTGEAAKRAEQRMKKLDVRLAVALDAPSGEILWKSPVDVTDCSDVGIGGGKLTLMYHDDILVLCGANANGHYWKQFIAGEFERRRLVALHASDGYKLWAKDANYRHRPIVIGQRIIAEPWAFDLLTGEQEMRSHPLTGKEVPWSIARPGHHCGMLTGCDNLLMFRSGFTGFYDLKTDSGTRHFAGHRLGCWINAIPTNGLVVMPEASAGCTCLFSIASTIVMEPRKPRRPWTLFSQTGPTTPVQHMALNFGAPGDRRDPSGRLWIAWPRPSDKPRNKSTDNTGLALAIDLKANFLKDGGFFSSDGDATISDSPASQWVTTSGARGLAKCSIPLLGEDDDPATYQVRLHLAPDIRDSNINATYELQVQDQLVPVPSGDAAAETSVVEVTGVGVSRYLDVAIIAKTGSGAMPVLCGIEVTRE